MRATQRRQRGRQERGAALVEFALVAVLLFMLIFGIIGYAYMMSFRQAVSQGAAEGARAGAVMPASATDDETKAAARNALNDALDSYDVECGTDLHLHWKGKDAGTCDIQIDACEGNVDKRCVSVAVVYHYRDAALVASVPIIDRSLPENLHYTAVAEINE